MHHAVIGILESLGLTLLLLLTTLRDLLLELLLILLFKIDALLQICDLVSLLFVLPLGLFSRLNNLFQKALLFFLQVIDSVDHLFLILFGLPHGFLRSSTRRSQPLSRDCKLVARAGRTHPGPGGRGSLTARCIAG